MAEAKRSWTIQQHVSAPLLDLLTRSDLTAEGVDKALEQMAARGRPAMLRADHPCLAQMRERTGIGVVSIARRYKRLLVEIEQDDERGPIWRYSERGRDQCLFHVKVTLGATLQAALIDKPLARLIEPTAALGMAIIEDIATDRQGWLDLIVKPRWIAYG